MPTNFVERMIVEHSELAKRIKALRNYIYNKASDKDDKIEFANKCLQLSAMKKYEEVLRIRLENQDIICENGEYFARLAKPCTHNNCYCDKEPNHDGTCNTEITD